MPVWLASLLWTAGKAIIPALIKSAMPFVVTYLKDSGHINAAEEIATKGAIHIYNTVKDIKTYPEYPSQNTKGQR